ncbi:GGDEF domain-containing protein [Nocardia crassostreae]|uniref:GGDEF domain-containing protein n=1 Tax=Nocardia crassostreae TaxID=53428 RepID=UPI00082BF7DF|nr:GGDEF domain-containing protein [Nocardia crassostreae]
MVRTWWRDPVDYTWLVHRLEARGALGSFKIVVAAGGAVMFVIALLTWVSPAGPSGLTGQVVFGFVAAGAGLWTLYWWIAPWPSANTSLLLLGGADVLVTAACLMDRNRVYGSLGAILLVVTGGYLTFFHGPRVLAAHTIWSLLSVLTLSTLMVITDTGDLALALSIILIMAAATVLVLPALQFLYWLLRTDALSDPLTMLLNRRGLDYYLSQWFDSAVDDAIGVMIIDLDRFKAVNDTYGHSAGDEVLVRAARCMRAAVDPGALVARSGGEEFVVITHLDRAAAIIAAERIRRSIATAAGARTAITASIGIAVDDGALPHPTPDQLLRAADSAMYRAKRLGGNAVILAGAEPE